MTARPFILWADDERTHIVARNAYQRGDASWRYVSVPEALVRALWWEDWQTPTNGPF